MHFRVAIVFRLRLTIIQAYNSDKKIPTPNAIKKDAEAKPNPDPSIINSIE